MTDIKGQQVERLTDLHLGGSTEKCYPSGQSTPMMVSGAMSQNLPSYKNPPVVETVLSVQFEPVEGFTNAHLGLFWSQLKETYPKIEDAELISRQEEKFGDDVKLSSRLPRFQIRRAEAAARLRMVAADNHAMVQLQSDRLVYNWRKMNEGEYPRWHNVQPRFKAALDELRTFLTYQSLGDVKPNQWEVTYVNQLLKGRDWHTPSDWPKLVPGLIGNTGLAKAVAAESLECKWKFLLPEDRGRLHVDLFNGYTESDPNSQEVLVLQLTARGGIDPTCDSGLLNGLEKGHAAIVRTFDDITGSEAHDIWEPNR